jgi:hypothetical protein
MLVFPAGIEAGDGEGAEAESIGDQPEMMEIDHGVIIPVPVHIF